MSFGTSAETFFYEFFFGMALLASFSVAILFVIVIQRFLGSKAASFSIVLIILLYVTALLGASFYLDSAGTLVTGIVTKKDDVIRFREEGDWFHEFQAQVQYQTADGQEYSSLFRTSEGYFDSLREGEQVQIRRMSINGWFDIARFADQSTYSWIPWRWIAIGLAIVVLGKLCFYLLNYRLGCLFIGILLFMVPILPFVLNIIEWRNSEDTSRTPFQATGTVEKVEQVTSIDPWDLEIEINQAYDIVVVRYTPQGDDESILGVDAVDTNESPLTAGMSVEIAYSPDAPRTVRLLNRTRSYLIRNPIALFIEDSLIPLVLECGFLLLFGLSRRLRR